VLSGRVVSLSEEFIDGKTKTLVTFEHAAGRAALELAEGLEPGAEIHAAIREEHIRLMPAGSAGGGLAAVVTGINFAGGLLRITVKLRNNGDLDGEEIRASYSGIDSPIKIGDEVLVNWRPGDAVVVEQ
jgi:ABC-type Fe3+/spermidine/putrescine transport system ATPase subunit